MVRFCDFYLSWTHFWTFSFDFISSSESLRKYPPLGGLTRVVTKDYECAEAKLVLREGLSILIPIHGIHHDPEIYDQPEEFRPERFSPEEIKKRPNCSFLPFGDGPRHCIGLRFAMMQTRIGLVKLLKHFRFTTCDRTLPAPIQISTKKTFLTPIDNVILDIQALWKKCFQHLPHFIRFSVILLINIDL